MKMQNIHVDRNQLLKGILIGVSALAMMAFCIVLIKPILDKTSETSNHLWIAGFRMSPGVINPLIISIFYFSKNKTKANPDQGDYVSQSYPRARGGGRRPTTTFQ